MNQSPLCPFRCNYYCLLVELLYSWEIVLIEEKRIKIWAQWFGAQKKKLIIFGLTVPTYQNLQNKLNSIATNKIMLCFCVNVRIIRH